MKKLTEKQKAFCEEYVRNGYIGAAAYRVAYKQENNNVAATEAYRMLRDQNILDEVKNVELGFYVEGNEVGLNKKAIVNALKQMLSATKGIYHNGVLVDSQPDYTAINNAITTYSKLTGQFEPEKKRIEVETSLGDIDVNKMSPEQLKELKDSILNEL